MHLSAQSSSIAFVNRYVHTMPGAAADPVGGGGVKWLASHLSEMDFPIIHRMLSFLFGHVAGHMTKKYMPEFLNLTMIA